MGSNTFYSWKSYFGKLIDGDYACSLWGLENCSEENRENRQFELTEAGSVWGYIQKGSINVQTNDVEWHIQENFWFSVKHDLLKIDLTQNTRMFFCHKSSFSTLNSMGGPVEVEGRLNYIDGCSDSLLAYPVMLGDPCLNLLHFPPNINQTMHTHPSMRAGIVSQGLGVCVTESENTELEEGLLFFISKNCKHNFRTYPNSTLDVISFHPDSDWGPTHHEHPMVNRTWVNGKRI